MPAKEQKRFQESAKKTIKVLRRATNTGQEPEAPQREAVPSAPDRQREQDGQQRPRQSVKASPINLSFANPGRVLSDKGDVKWEDKSNFFRFLAG